MSDFNITAHLSAVSLSLIDACGGFVSAALECDVSKSQLQRATDPNHPYTLKSSTIWHLEQACGVPIMSRALLAMSQHKGPSKDAHPLYLGIDLADGATDLTVAILCALKDGKISAYERVELTGNTTELQAILTRLNYSFEAPNLPCRTRHVTQEFAS